MSNPRCIALGDVHGCTKALAAVIDEIAPQPSDQIVLLGDVVDRGPDTKGTVEFLIKLSADCKVILILGNHEEMLLASLTNSIERRAWISFGGVKTLDSYGFGGGTEMIPYEHIDFLRNAKPYYETETAFFIHANYLAEKPLDEQPGRTARWEFLHHHVPGPHCSGKTAFVGHSAQESHEVLDLGYLKCLDTACADGGWLTAMEAATGQVWQADREGQLAPSGGA